MKPNRKGIYLILFAMCAASYLLVSLTELLQYETEDYFTFVRHFFLFVFTLDFFLRFFHTKFKKTFFKKHWMELLAVYPICLLYPPLGIVGICAMCYEKFKSFFKSKKLISFFLLLGLVLLFSAYCIYRVEYGKSVNHFFDAIWLCVVTVTTVGYGDIAPQTAMGKIILMVLMFFGVLFIGVVTTTMTTYLSRGERFSKRRLALKNIRSILDDLSTNDIVIIDEELTEKYKKRHH